MIAKETGEQWIWGRGRCGRKQRSGRMGNCIQDVLYERRIDKSKKEYVWFYEFITFMQNRQNLSLFLTLNTTTWSFQTAEKICIKSQTSLAILFKHTSFICHNCPLLKRSLIMIYCLSHGVFLIKKMDPIISYIWSLSQQVVALLEE